MDNTPAVVPVQAPGLVGNTIHQPGRPLDLATLAATRARPLAGRTPLPSVGQVVGFRERVAGPVVKAYVQGVESVTDPWAHEHDLFEPHGPDPNVWRVVKDAADQPVYDLMRPGQYRFELVDDPWPSVVVHLRPEPGEKGSNRYVITRQARRSGSIGWLPADQIGR